MLVWEAVIEAADTTLVTTEWAMYEVAKHPEKQVSTETFFHLPERLAVLMLLWPWLLINHTCIVGSLHQDRLYQEIQEVCGKEIVTEEHLPQLPYLNAVFHETLRRHSPVPLVPPRFVHENTNLAGYEVPAGTEVSTAMTVI